MREIVSCFLPRFAEEKNNKENTDRVGSMDKFLMNGFQPLLRGASIAAILCLDLMSAAHALDLPASTQAILSKLKLDPSILQNVDSELAVPDDWMIAARKEAALEIFGSSPNTEFAQIIEPFRERYPFIAIKYSNPPRSDRVIKPMMGRETNRYLTDIVIGIEEGLSLYTQNDTLEDLGDIPGFANVADNLKDSAHRWVATKLRYGCLAYNTDKIQADDLPRTWDDLLTSPLLKDGNLALVNRPNQWLASLWAVKGEAWGTEYVNKLFQDVRPQLRKENTNALTGLLAAGEFSMQLPGFDLRVVRFKERGAPVEYYCPSPAPAFLQLSAILKGTPRLHTAKIFINWFLSKEGQVSHFAESLSVPVHKELQAKKEFLPLGVKGLDSGNTALLGPTRMDVMEKMYDVWRRSWEQRSANR